MPQTNIRLVLVGAQKVGKKSIPIRLLENKFYAQYKQNLALEIYTKQIVLPSGDEIVLRLDVVSGVYRTRPFGVSKLRGADGGIIVYDSTSASSFKELEYWRNAGLKANPDAPWAMAAAKSDLLSSFTVSEEDGRKQAASWDLPFFQISAKTGSGVDEMFASVITSVCEKMGVGLEIKANLLH